MRRHLFAALLLVPACAPPESAEDDELGAEDTDGTPTVDSEPPPDSDGGEPGEPGDPPPTPRSARRGEAQDIVADDLWCAARVWSPTAQTLLLVGVTSGTWDVLDLPVPSGASDPSTLVRVSEGFVFADSGYHAVFDPFTGRGRASPVTSRARPPVAGGGDLVIGRLEDALEADTLATWIGFDDLLADWREHSADYRGAVGPACLDRGMLASWSAVDHGIRRYALWDGRYVSDLPAAEVPSERPPEGLQIVGERTITSASRELPFHDGADLWLVLRDRSTGAYVDGLKVDLADHAPPADGTLAGLWCEAALPGTLSGGAPSVAVPPPHDPEDPCPAGVAAYRDGRGYVSVPEAIATSSPQDVVSVCPGRWPVTTPHLWVSLDHTGPVTIRAHDGDPRTTILDGGREGGILNLPAGADVTIRDLGFEHGLGQNTLWNDGVSGVEAEAPRALTIEGCRFADNTLGETGSEVVSVQGARPGASVVLRDTVFVHNAGNVLIQALDVPFDVLIEGVRIEDGVPHTALVIQVERPSEVVVRNTIIRGNRHLNNNASLYVSGNPDLLVEDSTIDDNQADQGTCGLQVNTPQRTGPDYAARVLIRRTSLTRCVSDDQNGEGAALSTNADTVILFEDVDLGEGPSDNTPADVLECQGTYGAGSTFRLAVAEGRRCD